jgi:hypothetical protein
MVWAGVGIGEVGPAVPRLCDECFVAQFFHSLLS